MEITQYSKMSEEQHKLAKGIATLIESSVLASFPHMPKGLFRTARYEFHFSGNRCVINISFSSVRHVPSISIELSSDLKGRPAMTAEGQVSYLDLNGSKIVKDAHRLSKGFWSSTLDSSVPFVGLSFFNDVSAFRIYYQKDFLTVHGKPDFFKFEEIVTSLY
jgi:hypothetical protein